MSGQCSSCCSEDGPPVTPQPVDGRQDQGDVAVADPVVIASQRVLDRRLGHRDELETARLPVVDSMGTRVPARHAARPPKGLIPGADYVTLPQAIPLGEGAGSVVEAKVR